MLNQTRKARKRYAATDTNANRRHGGTSTSYRPHTEDLVGAGILAREGKPTAPYLAPTPAAHVPKTRIGGRLTVDPGDRAEVSSAVTDERIRVKTRELYAFLVSNGIPWTGEASTTESDD